MKKCYLLGYPVGHSMSAVMHNHAFNLLGLDFIYELKSVEPNSLKKFIKKELRQEEFRGGSVTIPHKVEIIKHLDNINEAARRIGAVNTILNDNGILMGYNTDGSGALRALKEAYGDLSKSKVVVLGAGGASRAICYHLVQKVRSLTILNRSPDKAANLAEYIELLGKAKVSHGSLNELNEYISNATILINTTSVGMSPNNKASPIPSHLLRADLFVFDIVYNPIRTKLIEDARNLGAQTLSGVSMLVYQGAEAFQLWTGEKAPIESMKNIVLKNLKAKKH
jgi:shikimate dehydrogenase